MKKTLRKGIGDFAINLGKNAVGKCMIPGMYDPKIPDLLKKKQECSRERQEEK